MGIFANKVSLWNYHRATLRFRGRIMGPIPKDPKVIEGWLRAKAGVETDEEVRIKLIRTLSELGKPVDADMTIEQIIEASEAMAKDETCGFKIDPEHGLYLEGRAVKAAIKESINILFPGQRAGPSRKGVKSFVAERVFVLEDRLFFGQQEPSGIEVMFGRVQTPQGPRSTVGYHEYVEGATLRFHIMEQKMIILPGTKPKDKDEDAVAIEGEPCLDAKTWPYVWESAQEIGLGALRSQSFGRFDIIEWEDVTREQAPAPGSDALLALDELETLEAALAADAEAAG